jgi:hypothetical protein
MTSVFVSHSSLDYELVRARVVAPLEAQGLKVWFSKDSIHGADEWEKRIRQALTGSEWFLVALTPNSVSSEWVRAEVDWALENRRGKVVPVLVGDCDPQDCHPRLRQIQYIDLRRGDPPSTAALLNVWKLSPASEGTVRPPPVIRGRRGPLPWIAAGVLLAAGLGLSWWAHTDRDTNHDRPGAPPSNSSAAASTPEQSQPAPARPVVLDVGLAPQPHRPGENVPTPVRGDTQVTYESSRDGDKLLIRSRLPYLERQRTGQPITGIDFKHDTFDWEMPRLSVKVLNNSPQSVMITECAVEVAKSVIDTEPVLAIADRAVNGIMLINEGWGDVINPVLSFKITSVKQKPAPAVVKREIIELPTFSADRMVRLTKFVPEELENEGVAVVSGDLEFGKPESRKKVPFSTTMVFRSTVEHLVPPAAEYDLSLTAGKAPASYTVPVSHNIKAGEAEQIWMWVASDKSARYELTFSVRQIDGKVLPRTKLVLDLFVPRSAAKRVTKAPKPPPESAK